MFPESGIQMVRNRMFVQTNDALNYMETFVAEEAAKVFGEKNGCRPLLGSVENHAVFAENHEDKRYGRFNWVQRGVGAKGIEVEVTRRRCGGRGADGRK